MSNYLQFLKILCVALVLFIGGSLLTATQYETSEAQQLQPINDQSNQKKPESDQLGAFIEQILKNDIQDTPKFANKSSISDNSFENQTVQTVGVANRKLELDNFFGSLNNFESQQPSTLVNYAPSDPTFNDLNIPNNSPKTLQLDAQLTPDGEKLTHGVTWRIYSNPLNHEGTLDLIEVSELGSPQFLLNPGTYIVNATYGFATKVSKVSIPQQNLSHTLIMNAGGLMLNATIDKHDLIPNGKVMFDIYSSEFNEQGERKLIASDIKQGQIVRLNAETYHIVSRYGEANAIVSAEIQIQPGKLIEAQMVHSAAEITLKLVNEPDGDALIGTDWSVFSDNGETIAEGNGAFPLHILASGDYEVVAEYRGNNFTRNFKVEAGNNRVIEVVKEN